VNALVRDDDDAFHRYPAHARGYDRPWTMSQWLERAPLGRNEGDRSWFHPHDEYAGTADGPS
jgi:predicted dithiol-disulfide oxidoreductase (DUF899 family)